MVTSPPYYGLRDYHLPATAWPDVRCRPMAGLDEVVVPAEACCLGMEKSPSTFVGHVVDVFRQVRRVLREDGTCWVNMGDSYGGNVPGSSGY